MKERILEFLKAENKSSAQFAEEIGVQPSGISHILSGRNNPSLDFILKMLEKYSFLSTEWLLFGKGNMYSDQGMQNIFQETSFEVTERKPEITSKITNRETSGQDSKATGIAKEKKVLQPEKIVLFYSDHTFTEYLPEK
jgi:transcriptional regulator with XRE-family HTH domain